jgi:1,4-dihydroxy-2-naphthoate octaprenyltransferase
VDDTPRVYDPAQSRLKSWAAELRAPFLTGSLTPVVLGTCAARRDTGSIQVPQFVLALLGAAFLHLGANIANDYYDHRSGNDEANRRFVRPFSGGSRLIQEGLLEPGHVLRAALLFYAAAVAVGVCLAWSVGPGILAFGILGILGGFFYTAPPLRLGYRGWGELAIGFEFGVLSTLGGYYVQTRRLTFEAFLLSLPMAFLIMAVLWINQFPDYEADRQVGKRHWVVRLGRRRSVWVYAALLSGAYAVIAAGLAAGRFPLPAALGLVTAPLAARALLVATRAAEEPRALAPANAATILLHLATGLLLSAGYLIAG